jgi:hypothetical protein
VGGKSTNEHSCDCVQESKESIHYDPTSFDSFKGWLLGICFGLLVIYYFTQRKAEWLGNDNRKPMIKVKTTD